MLFRCVLHGVVLGEYIAYALKPVEPYNQLIYIFLCTGTVRGGLPSPPFSTAFPSPPARQTQTTPATYIYIYIYVNPPSKDYCYYFYLQTLTKI